MRSRLIKKIYFIICSFGDNWKAVLIRMSYTQIKDSTTAFEPVDYFERRNEIKLELQASVEDFFLKTTDDVVRVMNFQLREVRLSEDVRD
jgi:hypothetical protein